MAFPSTTTIDNLAIASKLAEIGIENDSLDPAIRRVRMVRVDDAGRDVTVNRITSLQSVGWLSPGAVPTAAADSTATTTFDFSNLGDRAEVDMQVVRNASNAMSQLEAQVRARVASIIDRLSYYFIEGDGTGGSITGLANLVDAGQTIYAGNGAANGADVTLADANKLLTLVKHGDFGACGPNIGIAHEKTIRALVALEEAAGITPCFKLDPGIGYTYCFRGVPIYPGQVSHTETRGTNNDCSSLYVFDRNSCVILCGGGDIANYGIQVDPAVSSSPTGIAVMVHGYYSVFLLTKYVVARLGGIRNTTVI